MPVQLSMQGTVRGDGTLELDEKVPMPAGRVLVTVQPVVQPPADDPFWQRIEQIWARQRARGHVPRNKEEIDAVLRELDEEAEVEIQAAERLSRECRLAREQAEQGKETQP
jgi:hypothetical protein